MELVGSTSSIKSVSLQQIWSCQRCSRKALALGDAEPCDSDSRIRLNRLSPSNQLN